MIDYFNDMTYVGTFPEEDAFLSSTIGSVQAGMLVSLQIKFTGELVSDVRYKVYGNEYAIACMAFVAHWVMGKTRAQMKVFNHQLLIDALSIPVINAYCAVLMKAGLQRL